MRLLRWSSVRAFWGCCLADSAAIEQKLEISQADSKKAAAMIGHLRQILRTVLQPDNRVQRPLYANQPEVVLAAASLRALFFDDTPKPLMISFLGQHGKTYPVETLETDSSMLLLSVLESGRKPHISDLFVDILLNSTTREQFKLNERHPFMTILQEGDPRIASVVNCEHVWAPGPGIEALQDNSLGYQPGTGICQFSQITRRVVDLKDWGDVRIGYLREVPIRRRNVACYVANKLGGVHYDSTRLPRVESDANEFRQLAVAYDWDNQAVVHAGMIAVVLMCIELVHMPWFVELLSGLEDFHQSRQERLVAGLSVKADHGITPA